MRLRWRTGSAGRGRRAGPAAAIVGYGRVVLFVDMDEIEAGYHRIRDDSLDCSWNSWLYWSCSTCGAENKGERPNVKVQAPVGVHPAERAEAHERHPPDFGIRPQGDAPVAEMRGFGVSWSVSRKPRAAGLPTAGKPFTAEAKNPVRYPDSPLPGSASATAKAARSIAPRDQAVIDFALFGVPAMDVRPCAAGARQANCDIAREPIASRRDIGIAPKVIVRSTQHQFGRLVRSGVA